MVCLVREASAVIQKTSGGHLLSCQPGGSFRRGLISISRCWTQARACSPYWFGNSGCPTIIPILVVGLRSWSPPTITNFQLSNEISDWTPWFIPMFHPNRAAFWDCVESDRERREASGSSSRVDSSVDWRDWQVFIPKGAALPGG